MDSCIKALAIYDYTLICTAYRISWKKTSKQLLKMDKSFPLSNLSEMLRYHNCSMLIHPCCAPPVLVICDKHDNFICMDCQNVFFFLGYLSFSGTLPVLLKKHRWKTALVAFSFDVFIILLSVCSGFFVFHFPFSLFLGHKEVKIMI